MKPNWKLTIILTIGLLAILPASAQREYPSAGAVPEEAVWTREIYRTLDLTRDENGALYYPVEPQGDRMNLFTTLFRLLAQKKINAYEYQLDGTEHFTESARIGLRDVLDRFQIYYEMKKVKNRRDSVMSIHNSDIPSADVLSYFIKEVWYFDQRTSTFGSRVTALCPVLHRSEDFSSEKVKLPMFWIDYREVAPLLAQTRVMTSNYNNSANSSWDDFFTTRLYRGDIYKVTNLQNRTLAQYCTTDSAMIKEQRRIEKEIADFELTLYGNDLANPDSVQANPATAKKDSKKVSKRSAARRESASGTSQSSVSKREAAAPRATVRRQRH